MMRHIGKAVGMVLLSAVAGAASATVPIIQDGGFEKVDAAHREITDVTGQTLAGGWTGNTLGGVSQYVVNGNARIASGEREGTTPFGSQYLALEAIQHRSFRSIESQTISGFTAGQSYAISLDFAALNLSSGSDVGSGLPPTLSIAVTDGSDGSGNELVYKTFTLDGTGPYGKQDIPFTEVSVRFTALTDFATLSIGNQSFHSALGIDNVRLREIGAGSAPSPTTVPSMRMAMAMTPQAAPVPEPASWTLMLASFGVVGGMTRRRSGAARAAIA